MGPEGKRSLTQAEVDDAQIGLQKWHIELQDEQIAAQDALIGIDHLTGLKNRRVFDVELQQALSMLRRNVMKEISLVFIDLDHFKGVNDNFGHSAGDEVLKKVSEFLRHSTRDSDVVARFGGEEIIILMPGTGADDAATKAEALRLGIAKLKFELCPEAVTASFGVISSAESSDEKTLLTNVDTALYAAKKGGRDRVVIYSEDLSNQNK